MQTKSISIIDLFAGPGGLSEGFSAFTNESGEQTFKVGLSIEKDPHAHQTLLLRSFYRQFSKGKLPKCYYDYLKGEISRLELFKYQPIEALLAEEEAWCAELGVTSADEINQKINRAVNKKSPHWVLIGGPPCQAYSLVGRSRMQNVEPEKFRNDPRHVLYREYLKILAEHRPPVFVMENVKGILSSKHNGEHIFNRILNDLRNPHEALKNSSIEFTGKRGLEYRIYSFVCDEQVLQDRNYVIRSEKYGIPQARHQVILLGVRMDMNLIPETLRERKNLIPLEHVIDDLPGMRSTISKSIDSPEVWRDLLSDIPGYRWFRELRDTKLQKRLAMEANRVTAKRNTGKQYQEYQGSPDRYKSWYKDCRFKGVCNHEVRSHIKEDILRYFFVSCFGKEYGHSPKMRDFPRELRPNHKNVAEAVKGKIFADRFRVQIKGRPSSTITSHISKDGHYFIHYDPLQCRSLTVREAARIQTFPDNYFFEGPRTEQYKQVGNAVPPLLAKQIAEVVYNLFQQM